MLLALYLTCVLEPRVLTHGKLMKDDSVLFISERFGHTCSCLKFFPPVVPNTCP